MNTGRKTYRRYTEQQVLAEAEMYLAGTSIHKIAQELNMPFQTVSWHLMYPLCRYNYDMWIRIRNQLIHLAKNQDRALYESKEITDFKNRGGIL